MSGMLVLMLVLVGVIILVAALRLDEHFRRIMLFHRRRINFRGLNSVLPMLQLQSKKKYKASLSDIRDLVISLQLGTSLDATMTGALERSAEMFEERGDLGERLRRHVDSKLAISPEAVLEALAKDMDSEQLRELLNRIQMASEGSLNYYEVLSVSVFTIEEDMRREIEKQIERAPVQLTVPMVAGVFLPALILGMIPLLASGLSQMSVP